MAHLFRQAATRPMPEGAKLFTRDGAEYARWTARGGKTRTAKVATGPDGVRRIQTESATWFVRLRLADNSLCAVSTGCRDKSAAASRMAELVAEQEKIRAGIITRREASTAHHGRMDFAATVGDFVDGMRARGCAVKSCGEWKRYLLVAGRDGLGWRTLRDMDRGELERWLSMRAVTPKNPDKPESVMGARVHNCHVTVFSAFGNWCFRQGYTKANPFAGMVTRDERADRRHVRRALTVDELARLFEAAQTRPILEAAKINRGPDKGKAGAELSAQTLDRLRFLGWTRSLAYKTAALTGLRWGELRSITIGAARLDADPPHFILEARNEKARRGAQIPLRDDLAAELRLYLVERRSRLVGHSGASMVAFPGALDGVAVFDVPVNMSKVFNADCKAAGILKNDSAGRVVDVHALRHTFGTLLAKAGVPLQLAQRAMRHSTPALTANVYTHLGVLDVAGAMDKLPGMGTPAAENVVNLVTPTVTPDSDILRHSGVTNGNTSPVSPKSGPSGTECILTNKDGAWQEGAKEKDGGRYRTRTCDILRVRQTL